MRSTTVTRQVPVAACRCTAGPFTLGDNGDAAKTAPIKMIARTGQPIDHWYWGRIAHDLDGMTVHKPSLPIDYCHDSEHVIGYLNKFDQEPDADGVPALVCSGALVPYKGDDRATEIIFKARAGVPYEASINWTAPAVLEEIEAGASAEVNGYTLDGPAVIVRRWGLRGVAVCPYGADSMTVSQLAAGDAQPTVAVTILTHSTETETMNDTETTVEAQAVEAQAVEAEVTPIAAEAPAAIAEAVEAASDPAQAVEPDAPGDDEDGPEADQTAAADDAGARQAAGRVFLQTFGDDGARWFAEGRTFEEARELSIAALQAKVVALEARLAAAKIDLGDPQPASFQPADEEADGRARRVQNYRAKGLTDGQARLAAGIKLPDAR